VITAIDRKHTHFTVTRSAYTQTQVRNRTIIGPPLYSIYRVTVRFSMAVHVGDAAATPSHGSQGRGGGDSLGMFPVQFPLISYKHANFDFRIYSSIVD
jgi:hypothetical protein